MREPQHPNSELLGLGTVERHVRRKLGLDQPRHDLFEAASYISIYVLHYIAQCIASQLHCMVSDLVEAEVFVRFPRRSSLHYITLHYITLKVYGTLS